jgi:membrane-bound ClpP family serine protease
VNGLAFLRARLLSRARPADIARAAASLFLLLLTLSGFGQGSASSPAGPAQIVPAARQARNVAIITIEGMIDEGTFRSVKRRFTIAERAGADAVVIELNTPGGEVGAVLGICTTIKASPIRNSVAWVHPTAFSGGAVVAIACREIVTSDPGTLGDALPVLMGPVLFSQLPEHEQQKMLSPLVAELVDSARRNHYDEFLVQGLVSRGVELWLVENKETGARLFINRDEYRAIFGEEPVSGVPTLPGAKTGEHEAKLTSKYLPSKQEIEKWFKGGGNRPDSKGASSAPLAPPADPNDPKRFVSAAPGLSPIDGEVTDLMEAKQHLTGRALLPLTRPVISSADRGRWNLVEFVSSGSGPFVFKADQLKRYSLASATIQNDEELRAYFGAKNLIRLQPTWSEGLVAFMTNQWVKAFLVVIFLLGLFVEMTHPGLVLPGAVSMCALVGLVAPPMLIDLSAWWTVAAILGGITLLALEIFIIPGFGVAGVLGLLLLFAGLVGTFVPSGSLFPDTPGQRNDMLFGVATLLMSVATSGILMYFVARHFGSLPVFNRLVLKDPTFDEDGGDELIAAMATGPVRIGMSGTAVTPLRPAGRVQLGDRIIDVVSEVGYIPAGAPVKIIAVSDFRIAVEPA